MKPIQIYLKWEIDLHLDLLKKPMALFSQNMDSYKAAIELQLPITVNQFRKAAGPTVQPHPDERGQLFVYAPDEVRAGDDVIPPLVLVGAWSQIVAINEPIQQGKATGAQLIAAYPELHERAEQAAKELGIELPMPKE
jgi:hypothetical protein